MDQNKLGNKSKLTGLLDIPFMLGTIAGAIALIIKIFIILSNPDQDEKHLTEIINTFSEDTTLLVIFITFVLVIMYLIFFRRKEIARKIILIGQHLKLFLTSKFIIINAVENGRPIFKSDAQTLPLDEIMLQANSSLIISGHTLDKFSNNGEVKEALVKLFNRPVNITLVLLNPYSDYSVAHEPFHKKESRISAQKQIRSTLRFFQNIFADFEKPDNFTVLLSNYMPRFRTILVDEKFCYITLYMYGSDVEKNPEFLLIKTKDERKLHWFNLFSESLKKLIASNDVMPFIKDGRLNENWEDSRGIPILKRCLETACCRIQENCWKTVKRIILGDQHEEPGTAYDFKLCEKDYIPGTFKIDQITHYTSVSSFDKWVDKVLREQIRLIYDQRSDLFADRSQKDIAQKVKKALEFTPLNGIPLKKEIWCQEYSDVIHRLIMSFLSADLDNNLNLYPNLTVNRRDFVYQVLEWIEQSRRLDLKNWLHLSIAAGLLGVDEKSIHAATSAVNQKYGINLYDPNKDIKEEVKRVGMELLDIIEKTLHIDASNLLFHILDTNKCYDFKIVSFPDDYLETIFLLKFYEELLKKYEKVKISFIPRSIRCSNDISYEDAVELSGKFSFLNQSGQFEIIPNGPKLGGVNLLKLHPHVIREIYNAFMIDVRGARNYEMMQGINRHCFFGFIVCREFSEKFTGLKSKDRPFVYLHQAPGECSFEIKDGRVELTVNDQRRKWEGGTLADIKKWSDDRLKNYEVTREFYSASASEFHWKFGNDLESDVKGYLDQLSGRILVVGCGSGKEVKYLSDKQCNVFGFDFSTEAIFLAQNEHHEIKNRFFIEDLYNIDTVMKGKFNAIVANAALVHLYDRNDLTDILKKIRSRLEKEGLCFIRVLRKRNEKGEDIRDEIDYHSFGEGGTRWFVYYSNDELEKFVKDAGFITVNSNETSHSTYKTVSWISMLLKK